jgi:PleD family two-component response regulator
VTVGVVDGLEIVDVVLKLCPSAAGRSRDADTPARYGGEEMALNLPHTKLEGSHAIAERVRSAIEGVRVKDALIAAADKALYMAKRRGKNQTMRAKVQTANVVTAE